MGNGVEFSQPVDDKFFEAHMPIRAQIPSASAGTVGYVFNGFVHALACKSQHQLCISETNCTSLTTIQAAAGAAIDIANTDQQKESISVLFNSRAILGANLNNIVGNLEESALVARNNYIGGLQGPLPPNQWQLEVEHWQNTLLAYTQRLAVEYATGPSDPAMEKYVPKPANAEGRYSCKNQVSQSRIPLVR